jgi:hypothetical protein
LAESITTQKTGFPFPREWQNHDAIRITQSLGFRRKASCGLTEYAIRINWLCFFAAQKQRILHIPLSYRHLHSFRPTANWLCFFK